jgi:hypothetical protein
MTTLTHAFPSPIPALTSDDAGALIRGLMDAMDSLVAMIEQETTLVRDGQLRHATLLQPSKDDLARSYVTDMTRLSASRPALGQVAPALLEEFRARNAQFHDLLKVNTTVLATAHAVSEDLIRGVSGELARKAAPQTYGASGRPSAPSVSSIQPLAISRSL